MRLRPPAGSISLNEHMKRVEAYDRQLSVQRLLQDVIVGEGFSGELLAKFSDAKFRIADVVAYQNQNFPNLKRLAGDSYQSFLD